MAQARTGVGRITAGVMVGALIVACCVMLVLGTRWFLSKLQATVTGGMTAVEFLNVDPAKPPGAGSVVRVRITNRDSTVSVYDWLALLDGDVTGRGTVTVEGGFSEDLSVSTRSAGILDVEVGEGSETGQGPRWRGRLSTPITSAVGTGSSS